MSDPFKNYITNISSQATKHYTITPSDTLDLPVRPRAIYVNARRGRMRKKINLDVGINGPRTTASDAAVATLVGYGVLVETYI